MADGERGGAVPAECHMHETSVARSSVHVSLERRGQPCSLVSQHLHEACQNLYWSEPAGALD